MASERPITYLNNRIPTFNIRYYGFIFTFSHTKKYKFI